MDGSFYVYILASRYRGTLYIGVTNDISRRVAEHKSGAAESFTRRYKINRLVYAKYMIPFLKHVHASIPSRGGAVNGSSR